MSQQLLTGLELWKAITSAAAACRSGARKTAVAYVSTSDALRLGRGDVLVVNAGDTSMSQGATTKRALLAYLDAGVRLFNRPDLHAKVYVFGGTAIVGSANASVRASSGRSVEAALVTTNKRSLEEAIGFIDDLIEDLRPLTRRDIAALPDAAPSAATGRPRGPELVDDPKVLWAYWSKDVEHTDRQLRVVADARRRFRGRGKWTVTVEASADDPTQAGDLVLPVWSEDGDTMFGPPALVLGRHDDPEVCVLVVQDLDGCEALTTADEHQRARAQLPRAVRDLRAGSADVEISGMALEQLLGLFDAAQ